MTWQEAQDYCSTTYNDLVEIYEPGKVEASLVEAAQSVNYRGDAWIGLKTENLDWTWVDGEPLQIDNWERADDGGEASCALMIRSGVWRGEKCWQRNNLLCEGGEQMLTAWVQVGGSATASWDAGLNFFFFF